MVNKYFRDTTLLFKNTPICDCARICLKEGKNAVKQADDMVFIKYHVDLYTEAGELLSSDVEKYKSETVKRLLRVVRSVKTHGYAKGKYSGKYTYVLKSGPNKYEIISGKHRAAAAVTIGKSKLLCDIYEAL